MNASFTMVFQLLVNSESLQAVFQNIFWLNLYGLETRLKLAHSFDIASIRNGPTASNVVIGKLNKVKTTKAFFLLPNLSKPQTKITWFILGYKHKYLERNLEIPVSA